MPTFEEKLAAKPDTDQPRKAADSLNSRTMASGCRRIHAKAAYTPSASAPEWINLISGCAHGEVRQGVSLDAAIEIEQRYGASVPNRLILG